MPCTELKDIPNALIESAKEKALYAGEKVADRVANETSVIAEKANDIKGKVHSMADEAKK